MADKEISVIIKAKDAATAVFKNLGNEINALSFNFKKLDLAFAGFNKVGQTLVNAGTKMFLAGGGIVAGLTVAIKKASDFNEVQDKFQATMGASAGEAESFSKTLVTAFGMSEVGAKTLLGNVGTILNVLGASAPEVAKLSNEFVKLSSDIANFNNQKTEDVLSNIQSALAGQYRSLKQYGIVITDADLKQKAFNMGLIQAGQEMTATAKASALLALITEKSSKAIGQTQREFDGLDSQIERLKNRLTDFITNIGKSVIPMLENFIKKIEPIINKAVIWVGANQDLVKTFSEMALTLGGVLLGLGSFNIVFGTILKSFASFGKLAEIAYSSLFLLSKGFLSLTGIIAANPEVALLLATAAALYKTIDAYQQYKQAKLEEITISTMNAEAWNRDIVRLRKFNEETGNSAKTMQEALKIKKEQGLILDKEANKWVKLSDVVAKHNSDLKTLPNTVSLLGAAYSRLRDAAVSAFDSAQSKIEKLDETIKKSAFEKQAVTEKFAKITADILNKALEEKGDTLGVWNNKFQQANTAAIEAADLIRKASQEQDKVIKEELLKAASSKIDDAASIAQGLTDAVKKTDQFGNEQIVQTAEQSRQKALGLITTLKAAAESITDVNKKAAETEKGMLETTTAELKKFIDSIPKTLESKLEFPIDKTSYENALKAIQSLSGNKILKLNFNTATQDAGTQPEEHATGGMLSGYGGGDRVRALLEAGEFVIRKEAVKKFGAGLFHALNSLTLPKGFNLGGMIPHFAMPDFHLPQLAFAGGGQVPNMAVKHFGSVDINHKGSAYPVFGQVDVIETLKNALEHEKRMRQQ